MAKKILVIGVGHSQGNVVANLKQTLLNSRCVLIGLFLKSEYFKNIEYYDLIENSKIAWDIIDIGCMPGSTKVMIQKRIPEVIEEQIEPLRKFLGLTPLISDES